MNTFDFTPLFRSSIGFDRLMHLVDSAMEEGSSESYPPYNIEKIGEDTYRITMALAGFQEDDVNITFHDNTLTVQGKSKAEKKDVQYLHRGIARRAFQHHFQLADFIKIGKASLQHGLLSIELVREIPESMRPRKIEINSSTEPLEKLIEQKVLKK